MSKNDSHIDETLLVEYLNNETTAGDAVRIEEHIRVCSACRRELGSLQNLSALLLQGLSCEPQVDYDKIWETVRHEVRPEPSLLKQLIGAFRRPMIWAPATAFGAIALMMIWLLPFAGSGDGYGYIRVESIYSSSGYVMVLETAGGQQPMIWIVDPSSGEAVP